MTVNGQLMGSEIPAADMAKINVDDWAAGKIAKIEIFKNAKLLETIPCEGDEAHITHEDATQGPAFYHCRVTQTDGEPAVASPAWFGPGA